MLLERYKSITLSNASVYSRNSSLSGSLGSLRDEAQLATEAINRVETQVTDIRTLTVQQEYFNSLASGLFGLHYSSGVEEDGSTIRYAHTSERLEDSAWTWKSGIRGFFVSNDGGQTWRLGWDTADKVVKTAAEAVGVTRNLRNSLINLYGLTMGYYYPEFDWEPGSIASPANKDKTRIRTIGYRKATGNVRIEVDTGFRAAIKLFHLTESG